jgi:hypothetical protein
VLPFPNLVADRISRERWYFLPEAARRIGITVNQLTEILSVLRLWRAADMRKQESATGKLSWQLSDYAIELVLKEAYARRLIRSLTLRGQK